MVTPLLPSSLLHGSYALLAEQEAPSQTLPEPVRSIALMALLGIALLGMLMIVATLLGGHWVRRWGDRVRRPAVPPDVLPPKTGEQASPKLSTGDVDEGDTFGVDETIVS